MIVRWLFTFLSSYAYIFEEIIPPSPPYHQLISTFWKFNRVPPRCSKPTVSSCYIYLFTIRAFPAFDPWPFFCIPAAGDNISLFPDPRLCFYKTIHMTIMTFSCALVFLVFPTHCRFLFSVSHFRRIRHDRFLYFIIPIELDRFCPFHLFNKNFFMVLP